MNPRMKLMIAIAVALVLPTVAIADVMVTGSVNVHGSNTSGVWSFTYGPNAPQAAGFASISPTSGTNMADVDIENTQNMSVFVIDAFQINFESTGTFYMNVTVSSSFGGDAQLYYSASPMSLSDFTGETPSSIATTAPTPVSGSGVSAFSLTTTGTLQSATFNIGSTSDHIYIGFYLNAGTNGGEVIHFTGTLVSA